ncbi:efflux RND transporter periplasmic adaptor subunit [Rufibacter hautae]|uniref:Efflux RND transporter periplasmic adaptor subunit n=1 Tax=Rufibacter hautae TaxID=2595005 RepID=A0A5B6TUL1_9BACT|nr:efflux RND transporter periplasmic adaptor subunit [Rufibacter hautae]KAA3440238.1 efflux RND transporter periplasmic adaptor subunit [Rufibacter hautae]
MKKVFLGLFIVLFLAGSVWIGYYFYKKSNADPVVYKTEKPFYTNIVKKTVATGSIVPRKEIQIKPQVSGIVEELYVEAGQTVRAGQTIAKIRIVPNMVSVNNAETGVQTARIAFEQAKRELARQKMLYDQKVIAEQEYNKFVLDYKLRREDLTSAENNRQLVKSGTSRRTGGSNIIISTVDGMVLDVPVKVGASVIERNNFNEGTTIAAVADMKSLIFEGKIDESEVGKLREGMDLNLTIGAIEDKVFKAKLEYIAPKGVLEEGAVKFQVKAQVMLQPGDFLRAGYSANADIVLDQKQNVLAIKEGLLQFGKKGKDSVFVEVETGPQQFKKKLVKTGLSDGINIQVVDGLQANDKVKVVEAASPDEEKKAS